jgi:hypothetical protein
LESRFQAGLKNEIYTNLQDEINVLKDQISSFEHRISIFVNPKGVRMSHDYRDMDQKLEMKNLDDRIGTLRIKIQTEFYKYNRKRFTRDQTAFEKQV